MRNTEYVILKKFVLSRISICVWTLTFERVWTRLVFELRLIMILGFQYQASTQTRFPTLKTSLDNEYRVRTPLHRYLKNFEFQPWILMKPSLVFVNSWKYKIKQDCKPMFLQNSLWRLLQTATLKPHNRFEMFGLKVKCSRRVLPTISNSKFWNFFVVVLQITIQAVHQQVNLFK